MVALNTTPSPQSSGGQVSFLAPTPIAASTHGCCPGAAASPRSCPSAAWMGSPAQAALGPPAAEPGSGQPHGARTRVSSCCGHKELQTGPRVAAARAYASLPPATSHPSPVLDDHRRALRQFLALVYCICRRSLPLSSDGGHGTDLRWPRQRGDEVATRPQGDKPATQNCSCQVQTTQQRKARLAAPT